MSPGENPERPDKSGRRDREPDAAGRASAGAMLREARLAAGLDAIRLAADLRISAQAFEALETGQYHLLPGDPYVRALLSSLARHLHLDPQTVVQTYLHEMGVTQTPGQVAPYQDKGESLSNSHRQILIGLMVVLLLGFVVVLKQLNRPEEALPEAVPPSEKHLATLDTVVTDSIPESRSLLPDTANDSTATVEGGAASATVTPPAPGTSPATAPVEATPGSAPANPNAVTPVPVANSKVTAPKVQPTASPTGKPDSAKAPVAKPPTDSTKAKPSSDSAGAASLPPASGWVDDPKPQKMGSGNHKAILQATEDSLWVKVMRDSKPDDIRLLQKGKSLHIAYSDTIRIALSKKGVLNMTLDGKEMQPSRKRFKIQGQYYRPY
jgi:cytoskeleton protein RodZ